METIEQESFKMKAIDLSKWGKYTGREPLCSLPYSVSEFERCTGVELLEYEEAATGVCYCEFVQLDGNKFFVQGFVSRDCKHPPVAIDMEGNNPDPESSLTSLLDFLRLQKVDLSWCRRDLSPPKWALFRQGDDGNVMEVSRYFSQKAAHWVMNQFESQGHKQCYLVEQV